MNFGLAGRRVTIESVPTLARVFGGLALFLILLRGPAQAEEEDPRRLTKVRLYYNYYSERFTNTPLLIGRDCTCQLGYQTGLGVYTPLPLQRLWLNLHAYALGGTPGMGESHEQFGTRLEGQYHLKQFTFLVGLRSEWNVDRPSSFPHAVGEGGTAPATGLRETYIGVTWWVK